MYVSLLYTVKTLQLLLWGFTFQSLVFVECHKVTKPGPQNTDALENTPKATKEVYPLSQFVVNPVDQRPPESPKVSCTPDHNSFGK